MKGCGAEKSLTVKFHPSTAKLADRQRQPEERKADALHELTKTARAEMVEQLAARFFEGERPSDTRLIQIWMSKQRPAEKWMPKSWHILAKGWYYTMLRQAAKIAGIGVRTSPPRKSQATLARAPSFWAALLESARAWPCAECRFRKFR